MVVEPIFHIRSSQSGIFSHLGHDDTNSDSQSRFGCFERTHCVGEGNIVLLFDRDTGGQRSGFTSSMEDYRVHLATETLLTSLE